MCRYLGKVVLVDIGMGSFDSIHVIDSLSDFGNKVMALT